MTNGAALPCPACHAGMHAACTGRLDALHLDARCGCASTAKHRHRVAWEQRHAKRLLLLPGGVRTQKVRRQAQDAR